MLADFTHFNAELYRCGELDEIQVQKMLAIYSCIAITQ